MRFNNKNVILPEPIIDYLCFEAIEAGTVKFEAPNGVKSGQNIDIEYSFDKSTWNTVVLNTNISVAAG